MDVVRASNGDSGSSLEMDRSRASVTGWIANLASTRFRFVLVLAAGISVFALFVGARTTEQLKTAGYETGEHAESRITGEVLREAFGFDVDPGMVVLLSVDGDVWSAPVRAEVRRLRSVLRSRPEVGQVQTYVDHGPGRQLLISADRRSTVMLVHFRSLATSRVVESVADLQPRLTSTIAQVRLGGYGPVFDQYTSTARGDLLKTEMIALPLVFILLSLLLRSARLAFVPFCVGLVAVLGATVVLGLLATVFRISSFALNVTTALGLALAIDYSLLLLFRFREEWEEKAQLKDALNSALRGAGKPILFSSAILAVTMSALLIFPQALVRSMGIAGVVVAMTTLASTFLVGPSLLSMFARRGVLSSRSDRRARTGSRDTRLSNVARWVMRRPLRIALSCTVLLVVLGLPFLRAEFKVATAESLPTTQQARQVSDTLASDFAEGFDSPINVAVRSRAGEGRSAPEQVSNRIRQLKDVASVQAVRSKNPDVSLVRVFPAATAADRQASALVDRIRGLSDTRISLRVSGQTAIYKDFTGNIKRHIPLVLTIVVVATLIFVFALIKSVALSIKVLVANLLTISATFGILVLVFQDGHLGGAVGIDVTTAVVLVALIFGLSTDYGVFLLSRVKEYHDAGCDDRESVARAISSTGRVITVAALIFAGALAPLMASSIHYINQIGLAASTAVLLDAFVIRLLLVPALIELFGPLNWWTPRLRLRKRSRFR